MGRREPFLFGVGILTLALDQITKYAVTHYLPLGEPWNPIPALERIVCLTHITNTGVAFGLFPQMGLVFAILPIIVVAAILIFYHHLPADQRLMQVCLGLQLGGALGNLLDRLRLGHVVDFIDFRVWPVFNIADSAIVVGVALLAYHILTDSEAPSQGQENEDHA